MELGLSLLLLCDLLIAIVTNCLLITNVNNSLNALSEETLSLTVSGKVLNEGVSAKIKRKGL